MSRETGRSSKTAKRGAKPRRAVVTVRRRPLWTRLAEGLRSPPVGWGVLIGLAFVLACGALVVWSREQPLIEVGRVMDETRTVRFAFETEDLDATEQRRERARNAAPRVYVANVDVLEQIEADLANLPRTLSGVTEVEQVADPIRGAFRLTQEGLEAVRAYASEGEPTAAWLEAVRRLMTQLEARPILAEQAWQRATQEGAHEFIELRLAPEAAGEPTPPNLVRRGSEINAGNADQMEEAARFMARRAGFASAAAPVVVGRLVATPQPTYRFDAAATASNQNAAAEGVETLTREIPRGTVIFARGDTLTSSQYETHRAELRAFEDEAGPLRIGLRRLGLLGAVGVVTIGLGAYTALYLPRLRRSPGRMAGLASVMGAALAVACLATVASPGWAALTLTAPVVTATALLAIAYDRRAAMAYGGLLAVLVAIALDRSAGQMALILFGVAVTAWRLDDVRSRNTIVGAGLWTAVALALGVVGAGAIERPLAPGVWRELLIDASMAGAGGVLMGAGVLAALPWVERAFNATTGLKLIELRDTKQPLLKELQRRAPGTYNHSLNVASIAEAAADAIGADALLTYVGALYHDIGKMNKPEYFVENQGGGPNKHDKLSPAMSLLVIIGHVKDGLEMARANELPRPLHHFIEAHHGSTLVEFFFHRAKTRAKRQAEEAGETEPELPEEVEYRYPGPKPRTKEVAILMLADAVESATRAMPEPTSSRIDQLVRDIATKRLLDGQFDQCDLSFRELNLAVESISKSVASIYHGRIAYPAGDKPKPEKADKSDKAPPTRAGDAGDITGGGEQKSA